MFVESFEEPAPQGIQPCDDDPIELYLRSDLATRTEILASHPQVAGFIFLEKNHLTKAFLTKNVRDWGSNPIKNIVVAVTGCPESYTAFSVDDGVLGSDNTFLVESPELHDDVRTISVAKVERFTRMVRRRVKESQAGRFPRSSPVPKNSILCRKSSFRPLR